ncbi:MAG: rod shape-determining protein MreD [Candidatus Auribacterota bacterium]
MRVRPNYLSYSIKKDKPRHNLLLFFCVYFFTGIQANIEFKLFGHFVNINLLLLLASFLTIEFDWIYVSRYILLIGFILDIFSSTQLGMSTVSLWVICMMIARIKRSFYVEYVSTHIFLLFVLSLGYCFLVTLLHFILQNSSDFLRPFTQIVIMNATLTLVAVPFLFPLLKAVFHGKK